MYQESQTVDTSQTNGLFAINVGSLVSDAKRSAIFNNSVSLDPGITMSKIFANNGQIRAAGSANCAAGYTPSAGDGRLLRVAVLPAEGSLTTLSPDLGINSVPMAKVAEVAQTLQGLVPGTSAGNLVQLDNNAKLPAIDGSQLTNVSATSLSGGTVSATNISASGTISGIGSIPSGAVIAFNLSSCPTGWTLANGGAGTPSAQGRYIVGMPSGGTLGGTDGSALSDLEDRPTGQHSHGITDPGHNHSASASAPTATVTDNGHRHQSIDNSNSTTNGGTHAWNSSIGSSCLGNGSTNLSGGGGAAFGFGGTCFQTNSVTANISVSNSAPSVTVNSSSTGISSTNSYGGVANTNAPYVQLLYCVKN